MKTFGTILQILFNHNLFLLVASLAIFVVALSKAIEGNGYAQFALIPSLVQAYASFKQLKSIAKQ